MAKTDPQARQGASVAELGVGRPVAAAATRGSRPLRNVDWQGAGTIIHMDQKKNGGAPAAPAAKPAQTPTDRARISDHIGRQLRGMYDGLLNQPVPDRFMELVQQLEGRDAKTGDRTS